MPFHQHRQHAFLPIFRTNHAFVDEVDLGRDDVASRSVLVLVFPAIGGRPITTILSLFSIRPTKRVTLAPICALCQRSKMTSIPAFCRSVASRFSTQRSCSGTPQA